MSSYIPTLPRTHNEICCFPTATYPTTNTKRKSLMVMICIVSLVALLTVFFSIQYGGDTPLYQSNPIPPLRAYYSPSSVTTLNNEDCEDQVRFTWRNRVILKLFYFKKISS